MADRPEENRSAMWGHRARLSTQHVSHLTPPFGSRSAGHRLCRAAQPYDPIRFSRPALPSDSAERDAGAHPCEKGGPGLTPVPSVSDDGRRLVCGAPAKINLTLRILGRREDGYHVLQSVVAFADVGDRIAMDLDRSVGITVSGPFASEITGENLAERALRLCHDHNADLRLGHIEINKTLPVASGIGGGSADAAAALRLIDAANPDAINRDDLEAIALNLGADVPMCIRSVPALVTGIGETVVPIAEAFPTRHALLVNTLSGAPVTKTRDVFRAFNVGPTPPAALDPNETATGLKASSDALTLNRFKADPDSFILTGGNDLTEPASSVMPDIPVVLSELSRLEGCEMARLSGAGPTCFAIFKSATAAFDASTALKQRWPNWWIVPTVLDAGANARL